MRTTLVRQLTPDDWRTLREVRLAALADAPDAFMMTYADAVGLDEQEWRIRTTRSDMFAAFVGGEPVGLVGLFGPAAPASSRAGADARSASSRGGADARSASSRAELDGRSASSRAELDGRSASSRAEDHTLIAMWVAPALRGTGVADSLIDAAVGRALSLAAAGVRLEVAPGNVRAENVYARHGFAAIDETPEIAGGTVMRRAL